MEPARIACHSVKPPLPMIDPAGGRPLRFMVWTKFNSCFERHFGGNDHANDDEVGRFAVTSGLSGKFRPG